MVIFLPYRYTLSNCSVPSLFIPDATIIPLIWDDIIVLAILSTVLHWQVLSGLIKGKQRPTLNREILTLGIIGMSGSCLGSVPVLASEYWTKVSKQFSSSTAVSTLGSICFIVPFLFAVTFLRSIPMFVLSCVIITSSVTIAFKCFEFRTLWRLSRVDAGLWMCAAICPLLFGRISKALLSAVACAIAVIALRLFRPRYSEQVRISDNRGYYAEKERYGDVNFEEAGIAIVKFDAPILFINCEHLVEQLRKTAANIKGSPLRCGATRGRITRSDALTTLTDSPKQLTIVSGVDNTVGMNTDVNNQLISVKTIILDCSAVSDADFSGITTLADACVDFVADNVRLFFASVNASLRDKLSDYKFYEKVHKDVLFPTVHDAVLSSQQTCAVVQFHMSASMNGCRDVITLSKATSRCDELDADESVPSYTPQFEEARSSLFECSVSRSPGGLSVSIACERS